MPEALPPGIFAVIGFDSNERMSSKNYSEKM
jgi:hypothetical protein